MTYRLVVATRVGSVPGAEHVYDFDQPLVLVGRRAGADVALPHADVGGIHVRLERDDDGVSMLVIHERSTTTVGGERVDPGARRRLRDGDVVTLAGLFDLTYHARSPAGVRPTGAEGTTEIAKAMMRDLLAALGPEDTPTLRVVEGPHGAQAGKVYALPLDRELVLGRGEGCDATLLDEDLSREHLRIRRDWSGAVAIDLGSKNGTFVGSERLTPGKPRRLVSGDRILVGSTVLVYQGPADDLLGLESEESTPDPAPPIAPPAPAPAAPIATPVAVPTSARAQVVIAVVVIVAAVAGLVALLAGG